MRHPVTTTVAHGCAVCRKIIRAGDKHYFDSATCERMHVGCADVENADTELKPLAKKQRAETPAA